MGTDTELRAKIASEQAELGAAMTTLRGEVDKAAERAKKIGVVAGAALGVVAAVRLAVRLRG
jgi:hypothetical protein